MHSVTLQVRLNFKILENEFVFIVGDCKELGSWQYSHASQMILISKDKPESHLWSLTISLPNTVNYRYFLGSFYSDHNNQICRLVEIWETNIKPRQISLPYQPIYLDEFGKIEQDIRYMRGWLTNFTEVQLKIIPNSLFWFKSKYSGKRLNLYCQYYTASEFISSSDSVCNDDNSAKASKFTLDGTPPQYPWPGKLDYDPPSNVGLPFDPDLDILTFYARTTDLEHLTVELEVWEAVEPSENYSRKALDPFPSSSLYAPEKLVKLASAELTGFDFTKANKTAHLFEFKPNNVGNKKRNCIGYIRIEHLIIKPYGFNDRFDMSTCFSSYWFKSKKNSLDVGHRGTGSSRANKAFENAVRLIRENSITALKTAFLHGADFVEFDVNLSRDLIPIVYHDFSVLSILCRKNKEDFQYKKLNVCDLPLSDLRSLRLDYSHDQAGPHEFDKSSLDSQDDSADNQAFPTLEECFNVIDRRVGFMIELKYPQKLGDGTYECENCCEQNLFIDCILAVVFDCYFKAKRPIVFCCFDADICTMLSVKQNLFPILYLTIGQSKIWQPYKDLRANSIDLAIKFVKSNGILGISAHSDELIENLSLIRAISSENLILTVWGQGLNKEEQMKAIRELGAHALIYDKIHEHYSLGTSNVFMMEPVDSCLESNQFFSQPTLVDKPC